MILNYRHLIIFSSLSLNLTDYIHYTYIIPILCRYVAGRYVSYYLPTPFEFSNHSIIFPYTNHIIQKHVKTYISTNNLLII